MVSPSKCCCLMAATAACSVLSMRSRAGEVVLKFPKPQVAAVAAHRAAFVREAWVGARVNSPWVGRSIELPPGRQDLPLHGYAALPGIPTQPFLPTVASRYRLRLGTAKQTPEKAETPLGLVAASVPAGTRLSIAGSRASPARHLRLAARRDAG